MQLRTLTTALAALTLFATTATAYAQDPEAGDTGQWQQPNNNGQNTGWGQPNGNGGTPPQGNGQPNGNGGWNNGQNNGQAPTGNGQPNGTGGAGAGWSADAEHAGAPHGAGGEDATGISAASDWSNADNHSGAVHHLGIGFFGVLQIPTHDDLTGATGPFSSVSAPTVGGRYWINDLIGFEGAIGIGFNSPTVTMGGVSVSAGTTWGVGFHVGLPLALAHWKHFAFIIQPEVDLGIGGGDDGGDYSFSGFLFKIGGRIGAEIHMGFIGIPQLSLQAGVGLHLTYQSGNSLFGPSATGDHGASIFSIGTSIEKNPWDWFSGNITAIYYL